MFVCCGCCVLSLRRIDHSSRGVLPTVARRCVLSRNLEHEEAKARYRAVKIQPQWVVTPGKQTMNKQTLPYFMQRINSPRIMQSTFHSSTISPLFPTLHRIVKNAQKAPNFMACFECRAAKRVARVTTFYMFSRHPLAAVTGALSRGSSCGTQGRHSETGTLLSHSNSVLTLSISFYQCCKFIRPSSGEAADPLQPSSIDI
jgi:hypothetical protein